MFPPPPAVVGRVSCRTQRAIHVVERRTWVYCGANSGVCFHRQAIITVVVDTSRKDGLSLFAETNYDRDELGLDGRESKSPELLLR